MTPEGAAPTGGQRILLIEDDAAVRLALSHRLKSEGYEVEAASDGITGTQQALSAAYDLIILDVMLPGRSGFELAQDLRSQGVTTPIVMLSARSASTDKIVGLKLGADDYLTKPFEFMELLARISALLRRSGWTSPPPSATQFRADGLRVNFASGDVFRDGLPVELSATELRLLHYFVDHPGVILSRDQLLDAVWGYQEKSTTRTVDVHIARLRQKLEINPDNPKLIRTVRGLGYKFIE